MSIEFVMWSIIGLIGLVGGVGLAVCLWALAKSPY